MGHKNVQILFVRLNFVCWF